MSVIGLAVIVNNYLTFMLWGIIISVFTQTKGKTIMFNIGDNVFVDDGRTMFEGILLNDENSDKARIQEIGDGENEGTILVGSWDFVEHC